MKSRREFLKKTGLTGLSLLGTGLVSVASSKNETFSPIVNGRHHVQSFNMAGYGAPKISTVRLGIIGLGQRGPSHLNTMMSIEGVEIKALCDIVPAKAERCGEIAKKKGHTPVLYADGKDEWKKLCERKDLDLIIVTTPWYMHAEMSIYAMEQGKHVMSEVPAAGTIEECWQLVETSERTKKHLFMAENYPYMEFQLLTLNMARKGFFGEVVHGEGAYNTSKMGNNFSRNMYWDMWWLRQYAWRKGNIYPPHGLGPVALIFNINRGDRLDFLVSVESADFMMEKRCRELAQTDDFFRPFVGRDFRGNMNVTTIRTKNGKTIMLQHDATTPSPHNLIHGIYGTHGAASFDPPPARIATGANNLVEYKWASPDEFEKIKTQYTPEITRKMREVARQSGHGGSDIQICWRLIDCLRHGLPLDQDVYDAAAWSSIIPLSEWSVNNRSNSIDIPDFTAGAWKTNPLNMDINLEKSGSTKILL